MSTEEEELISDIKAMVLAQGERDPTWRFHYGVETLDAKQVVAKMITDKKFKDEVKKYCIKLTTEMVRVGRMNLESHSG